MFDIIIEHVINDLALQGDQGCGWDLFWSLVENVIKEDTSLVDKKLLVNVDRAYKVFLWKFLKTQPALLVYSSDQWTASSDIPFDILEAKQDSILFKAKEELQDSNIYGLSSHLKNSIAKVSQQMMCSIAKSKQKGTTQFNLGKEFDLDSKKVFHYLKRLETEGLIVRQPAYAEGMRTNIVYLSKFAPSVNTKEDEASDVICTYDAFRTRILHQLKAAKDQMVSLSDVVDSFGFRTHQQIRWARAAIVRLHRQGEIEKFMAFDGKIRQSSIRLKSSVANTPPESTKPENSFKKPLLRDFSCEYQVYQSIVAAGEKGTTPLDLMAQYPYLDPNYIRKMIQYFSERPKEEEMKPFTVYRSSTIEGKQTTYRYFAVEGWKKYQAMHSFVKPSQEVVPAKRASSSTSPSKKKPRVALPNTTILRRRNLLIEMIERHRIRDFNADFWKEFIDAELAAGGQRLARQTLTRLTETLQAEGKLKIWVTSIPRPSGLQELKTFLLHPSLSKESESVQAFVGRYRFDWAADTSSTRKRLAQVEVDALPGKKKKERIDPGYDVQNLWKRSFAADFGYIKSKFLRAQELHTWFFKTYSHYIDRRRILPQMPLSVLLKLCSALPYSEERFLTYLKQPAHHEVPLADLPCEIQTLVAGYQSQIRSQVYKLLTVLRSLALIQPVDLNTSTAYLLSKEGRTPSENDAQTIVRYPLNTLDALDAYWQELRARSVDMGQTRTDARDPLRSITCSRAWGTYTTLQRHHKEVLQKYINMETLASPLGDKPLCAHLAKKLGINHRLIKQYFSITINSLISARHKGQKRQLKKVLHPSPAIHQLIQMSKQRHQWQLPKHELESTFIGSRLFRSDRIRMAHCVEKDLDEYIHPTPRVDPFSSIEKDALCYAYCIMAYRSRQSYFHWKPITQVIPYRTSEKCRRTLCSMMINQPGTRSSIRQLSLAWEYLYTRGIKNGEIQDDRPFDTENYDLIYFLEYFLVQLQKGGNSLLETVQPYDLPRTVHGLHERFEVYKETNDLQVAPSQKLGIEDSFVRSTLKQSDEPSIEVIKTLIKILFVMPVETYSAKEAHRALSHYSEDMLADALDQLKQEGLIIVDRSGIRRIPGRTVNVSVRFLDLARPLLPVGLCRQARLFYNECVETKQVELTKDSLTPKQFVMVIELVSQQKVHLDFKSRERYLCTKRGTVRPKAFALPLVDLYVQRHFDLTVQWELPLTKFEAPVYTVFEQPELMSNERVDVALNRLGNPISVCLYRLLETQGPSGLTWTELEKKMPELPSIRSAFQSLIEHRPALVHLMGFDRLRYVSLGNIHPWLLKHSLNYPFLWCDTSGQHMPNVFEGCVEVIMSHLIHKPGISFVSF
ncbi:hypothetical protein BY458DRAFT_506082 [Sporodiniella umbellata]|nr:hypothetical protein BY458DRAFT_506082 [Sporodiniella umbellata]